MSKRLLLLASSLLALLIPTGKTHAQTDPNLFKLPDTVCNGHEIVPFNIIQTAQNYFWTFCPPNLGIQPLGNNIGPVQSINASRGYIVAEDDSFNYTFHINANGIVARMKYADGLSGLPSMITGIGSTLNSPGGLYLANNGLWHLFVVAGTDNSNSRLMRYDFNENGLKSMPTEVNVGNLGGGLNGPKQLYIVREDNNWFGFTFTKSDELIRLAFGTDLTSTPTLTNLGNIDGHFSGVSAITGIVELDNWHLFITNRSNNTVNRISFGNNLTNTPFVVNLGNMGNKVNAPVGISVTKDCNSYYGFVLNYGTGSFTTLTWDDQSIANQPSAINHGNVANFTQARNMTGIARDNGAIYLLATNEDNSVSKIIFPSCTNATPAYSDLRLPPSFKIDEPGLYTVFLTIDEGLPTVRTDCEQVFVYDHPPLTVSNDTLICQGDTIRLSALSFGADSFKWVPNYNIDTTSGQFVDINPTITTTYTVTTYYDYNCIVKTPVEVTVSKIVADAGPDRILADGSTTIVGGPGTTLGSQYTYSWEPSDKGFKGPTNVPVTDVRPPYDITYYLRITNTDGCKTIDSVLVQVPCDNINMPNAFKPGSIYTTTNKFGLLNQQLVKINYFKIFDRWGKEVFTTTNPEAKWDGKVDGKEAPMGVYVWEVDANCANTQQRFRRSGNVTLIR